MDIFSGTETMNCNSLPPLGKRCEACGHIYCDKFSCPSCKKDDHVGHNPNRSNGGWYRCWSCGHLWAEDGTVFTHIPLSEELKCKGNNQ